MTPDGAVAAITQAPAEADALAIAAGLARATLLTVADLLYVEADGHGLPWVRKAIVAEARS